MKIQYCLLLFLLLLGFTQCKSPAAKEDRLSDDALMDTVQRRTFNYFWEGAEPTRQAEISYAVFCLKKKKKV